VSLLENFLGEKKLESGGVVDNLTSFAANQGRVLNHKVSGRRRGGQETGNRENSLCRPWEFTGRAVFVFAVKKLQKQSVDLAHSDGQHK
jgi:hypothetical protein